jgi:hypothetical protein
MITDMDVRKNTIYLKGKVSGILDKERVSNLLRILCKPEWLIIHIENSHKVRLNDSIIAKGNFELEEILKVNIELNDKNIKTKI